MDHPVSVTLQPFSSDNISTGSPQVFGTLLRWEIHQLERPILTGNKALIFRHYILPSRTLNASMKEMADTTHVFVLLQQTWSDPYRTVEFHNRSLKLPEACVNIVKFVQRFKRSYVPQPPLRSYAQNTFNASMSYHMGGVLKEITNDMVDMICEDWKLTMARVANIQTKFNMTRPHFGKAMAKAMIGSRGRQIVSNIRTVYGRSASKPLIANEKPKIAWRKMWLASKPLIANGKPKIAWRKMSRSASPHHFF